jgi:DNA-binding NarL/FixJ family response regulator
MSAVYEAHLRMLTTLPVRTHEWSKPHAPASEIDAPNRRQKIRQLIAEGVKKRHIHTLIGVSRTAVQKHLRAIKRGK